MLVNQQYAKDQDDAVILILNNIYSEFTWESINTGITDQPGIILSSDGETAYIISHEKDRLYMLGRNRIIKSHLKQPGENQEGFVVDRDGMIYIALDSGDIITMSLENEE